MLWWLLFLPLFFLFYAVAIFMRIPYIIFVGMKLIIKPTKKHCLKNKTTEEA
jgi:hypothetical protein